MRAGGDFPLSEMERENGPSSPACAEEGFADGKNRLFAGSLEDRENSHLIVVIDAVIPPGATRDLAAIKIENGKKLASLEEDWRRCSAIGCQIDKLRHCWLFPSALLEPPQSGFEQDKKRMAGIVAKMGVVVQR